MATGHNAVLAPVANWNFPALTGAGALRSSANDMLTLLEAFLGYQETPLTPAMKTMLDVRRPAGPAKIGLAWFLLGESAWHGGGTEGFRSFAGYDPKAGTGAVVLSNAFSSSGIDDLAGHIWSPKAPLANPEPPMQRTGIPTDPRLWITTRGGINCRTAFSTSYSTARAFSRRLPRSAGSPSRGQCLRCLRRAKVFSS